MSNAKSVSESRRHRSDRFECGRLDVVLPRHTIIGVTEYHRRDGFPHADPLKVCCEAAPEAVPTFPTRSPLL
jgi:hypothetical protein